MEIVFIIIGLIAIIAGIAVARAQTKRLNGSTRLSSYQQDNANITRWVGRIAAIAGTFVVLLFGFLSTTYFQGVGEARVIVNADGTIAGEDLDPGMGNKWPWQNTVDFDLFSQELQYVGNSQDGAPSYSGGTVNGAEVTVSNKGLNGGQTRGNTDVTLTYSLDADKVTEIYGDYKSQERFTKQIVEKTVLATIRQVATAYTPTEYRGDKQAEVAEKITEQTNDKLQPLGVTIEFVNLQDTRYSDEVEAALKKVEVANQNVLEQEAILRAKEIEAQQVVASATAQAEANRILNENPLTPEALNAKYIEALKEGTVYVVPQGSTPLIQTR